MGRHGGWLGRGPSTVLVRDFAAKMNMFLLRSIKQRDRGQGEVTADGKMKSSRVLFHLEEKHNIILQDAELDTFYQTPTAGGSVVPHWSSNEQRPLLVPVLTDFCSYQFPFSPFYEQG